MGRHSKTHPRCQAQMLSSRNSKKLFLRLVFGVRPQFQKSASSTERTVRQHKLYICFVSYLPRPLTDCRIPLEASTMNVKCIHSTNAPQSGLSEKPHQLHHLYQTKLFSLHLLPLSFLHKACGAMKF